MLSLGRLQLVVPVKIGLERYAIQANVITFSSMMGNWKVAQQMLQEMKRHHVRWDVASCNASLSSSFSWSRALMMLRSMAERGTKRNAFHESRQGNAKRIGETPL
eukprot:symbB.v1.2.000288.t1/scaffold24.1/size427761/4